MYAIGWYIEKGGVRMNTNKERSFEIVSGPNKDTLFDACKYAYSKNSKIAVEFGVALGYTMPRDHPGCAYFPMNMRGVVISSIEHEDGSGESFNLQGYCRASLDINQNLKAYRFEAYYNTKKRSGTICFSE